MVNRLALYGYKIEKGVWVVVPENAAIVQKMFRSYLAGHSFNKIVKDLNDNGILYDDENTSWTYYRVRAILINPKYTGAYGHPAIIDTETFDTVQEMIKGKTANWVKFERDALRLKPYLYCKRCKAPLRQLNRVINRKSDEMYLTCDVCRVRITVRDDELLDEVDRQLQEHFMPTEPSPYRQSDEAVTLTNAINRSLEKPDNPAEVIELILHGAAARYDCWPDSAKIYPDNYRAENRVWKNIDKAITHITITPDKTIKAYFKD